MGNCSNPHLRQQNEAEQLLPEPVRTEWGSIDAILSRPPEGVTSESRWRSVILMWLLLPFYLVLVILGGTSQIVFVWLCRRAMASLGRGRPWYDAVIWWNFTLASIIAFVTNGLSRLQLFGWERKAWGNSDHFWHGEGVWACSYAEVEAVMRSEQPRVPAFGCIPSVVPDLFPKPLLIFLPNLGANSEWSAIRSNLHSLFLDLAGEHFRNRLGQLRQRLSADVPQRQLSDLDNTALLQRLVVKCIFYVMLGHWVSDGDADTLTSWRNFAPFFILPRLLQRFLFDIGIKKVKQLRKDSVALIEKYDLREPFHKFNQALPPQFRRETVVQLCDEIMYAVGFAGIGGTCACVENAGKFLQVKNAKENGHDALSFERYPTPEAMLRAYQVDPVSYIKEVCRLAPPVTSLTAPFPVDTTITMGGESIIFRKGTLRQLALSLANRDPLVFQDPLVFEPQRVDLNKALTWNGAFGVANDDKLYPRLCPGRFLALEVAQAVLDHFVHAPPSGVAA